MQSLAVKYRPTTFEDVTEQGSVKTILRQQLKSGEIKHAYLFCGGAGTGKTTTARIFANEINDGKGTPTEIDAASNNSVNDVRTIIQQSRMATLDGSKYRIYIIDECHSLSNSAWQAMLKLLEEPPETAIFIFCTTDPQKIPKTILSRVQRYDFQRISQTGIVTRLRHILYSEMADFDKFGDFKFTSDFAGNWRKGDCVPCERKDDKILVDGVALVEPQVLLQHGQFTLSITFTEDAIEYIAKLADGGMRDAITMLDKCLAYSSELTIQNVVTAIGTVDYDEMLHLTDDLIAPDAQGMLKKVEELHRQGKDLKLFIRNYTSFVLDLCKYYLTSSLEITQIPDYYHKELSLKEDNYFRGCQELLKVLLKLNADIKWDTNPKAMIEANLFQFCLGV